MVSPAMFRRQPSLPTIPLTATVRAISKLLLVIALGACGAPGSDSVFTQGNPRLQGADSAGKDSAAPDSEPAPQVAARPEIKRFEGQYHRLGGVSQFRPCGAQVALDVYGSGDARYRLQERVRWLAVEQGRRMFGIFYGAIVTDTPKVDGPARPRTRFMLAAPESLRTWLDGDCRGKAP